MTRPGWQIPIIIYHHVSPTIDYYTNTPPDVFERQLAAVAERYEFWTLRRAAEAFERGESAEGKVVVTFDDGYEDNYTFGLPRLDAVGAKATFFILPRYAGVTNEWNAKAEYRVPHMDWMQTRELAAEGHEIGSHGISHRPMASLDRDTVLEEIRSSKAIIEDQLGAAVDTFSYPYGITTPEITELVRQSYRAAVSTVKSSVSAWNDGSHALRRVYLPVGATVTEIHDIVSGRIIQ